MNRRRGALAAAAAVRGSGKYPGLHGEVTFRQLRNGVLVGAEIYGLPQDGEDGSGIFAFHIHSGSECGGEDFSETGAHFNPGGRKHPFHAGDLPPLFGNHGYAYMSVFTDRFTVEDIIGRVVVIHRNPDDFKSQPAGDAGEKIGCGKIE